LILPQSEIIQIGLQCATNYYIRVVVTGEPRGQGGKPETGKGSQAQSVCER